MYIGLLLTQNVYGESGTVTRKLTKTFKAHALEKVFRWNSPIKMSEAGGKTDRYYSWYRGREVARQHSKTKKHRKHKPRPQHLIRRNFLE